MKNEQIQHQIEETQSLSEKVINTQLDREDRELDRYSQLNVSKMQTGFSHFREKIKKGHKSDWY